MKKRNGFTLIELLVVIAIIAILAAILFPVFVSAKAKGRQTQCMSNMRQLAIGMGNYGNDWSGATPYAWNFNGGMQWDNDTWREHMYKYVKSKGVFFCPIPAKDPPSKNGYTVKRLSQYGINVYLVHQKYARPVGYCNLSSEVQMPSKTILIGENRDGDWSAEPLDNSGSGEGAGQFYPYHGSDDSPGGNFIFADCHAKFLDVRQTQSTYTQRDFYLWRLEKTKPLPTTVPG